MNKDLCVSCSCIDRIKYKRLFFNYLANFSVWKQLTSSAIEPHWMSSMMCALCLTCTAFAQCLIQCFNSIDWFVMYFRLLLKPLYTFRWARTQPKPKPNMICRFDSSMSFTRSQSTLIYKGVKVYILRHFSITLARKESEKVSPSLEDTTRRGDTLSSRLTTG